MGNGNKLYLKLIATLIIGWVGAYFIIAKFHKTYCHNQSAAAASTIKETPDIVMKARNYRNTGKTISALENELIQKYHLNIIGPSTDLSPSDYIYFMQQLLVDPDTAEKLAAYKVSYYATDTFRNFGTPNPININAELPPRQVLEYIQTH